MANDLDLAIVVRAKDLLTAELKRMGVSLGELGAAGQQAFTGIQAAVDSTQRVFRQLGGQTSFAVLEQSIKRARADLHEMRQVAELAGVELTALERHNLDRLQAEIREGEQALRQMRGAEDKAAEGASRLGAAFKTVGVSIKSALLPLAPILTLTGAAFAATDAVKQAAEFQTALAGISAEAGVTGRALDLLQTEALETTRALGIPEAKAAPVLLKAITDGALDAADGLGRFDAAARLAQATSADLGKTISGLNSILNAYAGELGAARAADVLFGAAVRAGKLDVDEFAGGIGSVLPLVRELDVEFEELTALLVLATKAGGGFEQGLQGVRGIIGALIKPSDDARAALGNIDFSLARIQAEGLVPVLSDIADKLDGDTAAIERVFPGMRSLPGVIAALSSGSRGLAVELDALRNSAGGVEAALGRRIQDPAERLRIVFNGLRSEFSQSFGGAFFRGVDQAEEEMGGFSQALKGAREIGKALGDTFGVVFPAVGSVVGNAAAALRDFIASIGGVEAIEGRMRAVGDAIADILGAALRIARIEIEALVRTILLIPRTVAAAGDELSALFGGSEGEAAQLAREIEFVQSRLDALKGPEIPLFDQQDIRKQTAEILKSAGAAVPPEFARLGSKFGDILREDLEKALNALKARKMEVDVSVKKSGSFEAVRAEAEAIAGSFDLARAAVADLDEGIDGLAGAFRAGAGREAPRTLASVSAEFARAQNQVVLYSFALDAMSERARENGVDLQALAAQAREMQDAFGQAADQSQSLQQELSILLAADAKRITGEIGKLEAGLADSRSVAELLGLTGEEALEKIGKGADLTRLQALKAELADIEKRLAALRNAPPILPVAIVTPKGADLGRSLKLDAALRDATGEVPAFALALGVNAATEFARGWKEQIDDERRDRLRVDFPDPVALSIILNGLDVALFGLRELDKERQELDGAAIALEIEVEGLNNEQLRRAIDLARERASRENLKLQLGIEGVSDREMAEFAERAALAVDEAQARASRAAQEREAIRFGIALDSETLEADLIRARDEAQAFADSLGDRAIRAEAITLGISVEGKDVDRVKQEIDELNVQLREHPVKAAIADGFANAFTSFITGAKSAKEAFRDFAVGVLADIAQLSARRFALSVLFPGGAADGAVFPAVRGVVVPPQGLDLRAYARGGSPLLDTVGNQPTVERATRLAGMAIVPLSGGGVATPGGDRLPLTRLRSGELAVKRYALGDHLALMREAGPEAVMRTYPGPSLRAADGGLLPLQRVAGGRLGVRAYQAGGIPSPGRATSSGPLDMRLSLSVDVSSSSGERRERERGVTRAVASAVADPRVRELIEQIVAEKVKSSPGYRAGLRGDRA